VTMNSNKGSFEAGFLLRQAEAFVAQESLEIMRRQIGNMLTAMKGVQS